jgi:hypothetical protein
MPEDDPQQMILHLLDVLSVGMARGFEQVDRRFDLLEGRFVSLERRLDDLTAETRGGFDRVERRIGNVETRVERLETETR